MGDKKKYKWEDGLPGGKTYKKRLEEKRAKYKAKLEQDAEKIRRKKKPKPKKPTTRRNLRYRQD
jgi:hypothetical protein